MSLDDKPGGTRTRLVRLAPELAKRGHVVTVVHTAQLDRETRDAISPAVALEVSPASGPGPARRMAFQRITYRRLIRDLAPDVVSAETWPMPNVPGLMPVVHDLRYLGLGLPLRTLFRRLLEGACQRAIRIHTVSTTVARELLAVCPIAEARTDIVPNGVPIPELGVLHASPSPINSPYVLVVGHDEPRKDFSLAAELAPRLSNRGITIVRVGRGSSDRASRGYRAGGAHVGSPRATTIDANSVVTLGIVPDAVRDLLYHHALAVLVPSRFEGFGLVPLEALAAGGWVVASRIGAHREILGDAASFFGPGNAAEAFELLVEAIDATQSERARRASRGRAQAARFSPQRAAEAFETSLREAQILA